MARRGLRRLERPPGWALVVLAVAVIAVVALTMVAVTRRHTDPVTPQQVAQMKAASTAAAASESAAHKASEAAVTRILVVGDSWTGGSDMGGRGPKGWPMLLQADLNTPAHPVTVAVDAAGGAGYVDTGTAGATFPAMLNGAFPDEYDVVIFFGSRNDTEPASQVQAGAQQCYQTVHQRFPQAKIIAIAPSWINESPPAFLVNDRDAIAAAAKQAGATFIDPIADGWFTGPAKALIGSDKTHPVDEGHRYIADKIKPVLQRVIGLQQ